MTDVEQELLQLKDAALAATRRHDGAFYAVYLSEDAVAVTPAGIFGREAIVAQMGSSDSRFASDGVDGVRAVALSSHAGYVTYRARYPHGDVAVTTIYRRDPDGWKGVFYQQTALPV